MLWCRCKIAYYRYRASLTADLRLFITHKHSIHSFIHCITTLYFTFIDHGQTQSQRAGSTCYHAAKFRWNRLHIHPRPERQANCSLLLPRVRYVLRIVSNFNYKIIPDLQLSGSYGCTKEVCQFRDALSGE